VWETLPSIIITQEESNLSVINRKFVIILMICVHNLLFRWFISVDMTDPIPDDTTLVKFRERLKDEGFGAYKTYKIGESSKGES